MEQNQGADGPLARSASPWAAPPAHEPVSRAPWPPLVLAGVLLLVFVVQALNGEAARCAAGDPQAACARYAFAPRDLDLGRWRGVFTALFMHGGWAHVGFNSVFAVAFGAPVARLFGLDLRGVVAFGAFFLLCGAFGNLGYAALHPHGVVPVIGASGAVAGFMGAASRLMDRRHGGLAPLRSRTVVGMAAGWLVVNLIAGVAGVDIGFGAGGQPVAWEAHLFGYGAGLLLLAPTVRLLRREPDDQG